MSLDTATATYKNALKAAYTTTLTNGTPDDNGLDAFLDAIVDATKTFVKSATIHYSTGLVAGSTTVTGTFNGELQ